MENTCGSSKAKFIRLIVKLKRDFLSIVSEQKSGENIYRILEFGFGDFKVVLVKWGTL